MGAENNEWATVKSFWKNLFVTTKLLTAIRTLQYCVCSSCDGVVDISCVAGQLIDSSKQTAIVLSAALFFGFLNNLRPPELVRRDELPPVNLCMVLPIISTIMILHAIFIPQ
jgi:hypothetical protein